MTLAWVLYFALLIKQYECGFLSCITERRADFDVYLATSSILDINDLKHKDRTHISANPGESVISYSPETDDKIKRVCEGGDTLWQGKKGERCVLVRLHIRRSSPDILSLVTKTHTRTEFITLERKDYDWSLLKQDFIENKSSTASRSRRLLRGTSKKREHSPILDIAHMEDFAIISKDIYPRVDGASFLPEKSGHYVLVKEWEEPIWEAEGNEICTGVWLYTSFNNYTSLLVLCIKMGNESRIVRYGKVFRRWKVVDQEESNRMFASMKKVKFKPRAVIRDPEEVSKYIDNREPFCMPAAFVRLTQLSDEVFEDEEEQVESSEDMDDTTSRIESPSFF
ncbi:hypothetical protein BEWA_049630 [Theileria equi strain WA]|uniref:Signal peptide-containing protein n=1 Tax=Theileria equi strain WA TaxID=1537102 RepID=L1LAZ1_THEEQ|nr:hypothetical protein BEWA_049630 [Theileria equi strain WA]EKX72496.1 hypothetical protein BEWA_049630 [Theileria equi strain WA]|eukprot:XP_004831948.1 hypothetical protein BEWA_049630 [Theileria equi strain WA]